MRHRNDFVKNTSETFRAPPLVEIHLEKMSLPANHSAKKTGLSRHDNSIISCQKLQAPFPAPAIIESYNYDGYGNAHGFNPANAATSLLYTGEMYDSYLQHYYLRARWYDQQTGRFNRMDPFRGSNRDPESFHKYLYCRSNPVNALDPPGSPLRTSSRPAVHYTRHPDRTRPLPDESGLEQATSR